MVSVSLNKLTFAEPTRQTGEQKTECAAASHSSNEAVRSPIGVAAEQSLMLLWGDVGRWQRGARRGDS